MPCILYQKVKVPGINWFAVDVFNCFYVDSHVLFYVYFLILMQPTHICYNTHVPVLTIYDNIFMIAKSKNMLTSTKQKKNKLNNMLKNR
jgi:hypothetical protein